MVFYSNNSILIQNKFFMKFTVIYLEILNKFNSNGVKSVLIEFLLEEKLCYVQDICLYYLHFLPN